MDYNTALGALTTSKVEGN